MGFYARKIQRNGEKIMKYQFKRGLSLMLVLVMVISLLSGLTINVDAASYSYNQGQRGVTATSLTESAEDFYAEWGTTYEILSALSGSSSLSSVPNSALYKELKSMMIAQHDYETSYADTKDLYRYTDCQNGGGKISSFYSGKEIGPDWDGGSTWNREHTWPNSKGLGGNDENDIMMLRPTSSSENSSRGNKAYGKSAGYYNPNSESGGKYDVRGDVARIFLYVYVRWGNVNGNGEYTTWGASGVMESKEVLLNWMESDPVDTWELGRNDVVEEITGTRNVFVDYPELAFLLFGEDIPTDMTTPSGEAGEIEPSPSEPTEPEETEPEATKPPVAVSSAPVVGKAYKFGMVQGNVNKTLYITGDTANKDYYLATTEDAAAAVDVYVEEVSGGYRIYFNKNGAKTYIDIYKNDTYVNIRLTNAPTAVFTWNEQYKTFVTNVGGTDYYMGTYNTFETLSASKLSYAATSFPATFYEVEADEPEKPVVSNRCPLCVMAEKYPMFYKHLHLKPRKP